MTCKTALEGRILGHFDDQVIPAKDVVATIFSLERLAGPQLTEVVEAGIGIKYDHNGSGCTSVGDAHLDCAVFVLLVTRANIESCGARAEAAFEMAEEAIRAVDTQIVARGDVPTASELFTGLKRVHADVVGWIGRAHLKRRASPAGVPELQLEGLRCSIHSAVHIQLIGQRTRGADAFLLLR